jgi:hypothetical protein
VVDAGRALEAEARDVVAVPDGPDHGHQLARRDMSRATDRLDALDDRLDLPGGRVLLHHDHHLLDPFF